MLDQLILNTLSYFDVQNHPLTLIEISKYLFRGGSTQQGTYLLSEISSALDGLKHKIDEQQGFYFLKGREELVTRRLHNNFYATPRLKRARRFLPLTRHIPFIRAVALSGSEALNNSKQGSDIDLLVLTKKGRMWLGRLFISFYFQLLGMRRYDKYIENRFCLNHYIEAGKNLTSDKNIYTAIEYVSLIPFFGADAIYEFQQKNLDWISELLNHPEIVKYNTPQRSVLQKFLETLLNNSFGSWLEKQAAKYQLSRIEIQDYITVEPDELSFHPGSKGQQILSKFGKKKSPNP